MSVDAKDLELVLGAIDRRLGDSWTEWPGGWPDDAELALVDAVLSIRARYGGPRSGVRGATQKCALAQARDRSMI